MDSYIGWIAAVLTVGILYFFSGSEYSRQKKRRNAEKRREKKYDAVAGQFNKSDRDQEYMKIRQKIANEMHSCSSREKRELLAKKLYALKDRETRHEKGTLIANGIAVPLILAYIFITDRFIIEYMAVAAIGGLVVLVAYIILIGFAVLRKINLCKLIYIVEDMVSEIDGAGYGKQEMTEAEDIDDLISRLRGELK